MIKKFYFFAWLMLAGSVLLSLANGGMSGLQMIAFSLVALALVYALALWAVLENAGEAKTE